MWNVAALVLAGLVFFISILRRKFVVLAGAILIYAFLVYALFSIANTILVVAPVPLMLGANFLLVILFRKYFAR